MSLVAGKVFAGHTVMRPIGSGALGEVYLAEDRQTRRPDALRVLPGFVSADGALRARFEREADLAATLWHANIVGVHGRGEERGLLWLATEFVEGIDAARLVRDRYPAGMPVDEVLDIVDAVADALDYAHGRQLAHGAVTPANVVLTASPKRRILLADFGVPRPGASQRNDLDALAAAAQYLLSGAPPRTVVDASTRYSSCRDFAAALREELAGAATMYAALPMAADPTARLDSPATGPKQPVFTPAWSEEPPPNPYLEPYPEDPYPDPDPAHSPTMAAIPVPAFQPQALPPPSVPEPQDQHSPGPTGHTWAMAGVAAVVVLVIVLVVIVLWSTGTGTDEAQPDPRPRPTTSAPSPPVTTTAPTTTDRGRAAPPPVGGPDGVGETCLDGYQINGQAGWASHAVRGNPAATCAFVGNVLQAYWNAADPNAAQRTVVAAGAIPCADGAQCSGTEFVVTCAVEGADPWVTCRGGRDAVVYLY